MDGNNNIVIQDTNNTNLHISITELQKNKQIVHFIIVTTTLERIKELLSEKKVFNEIAFESFYGQKLSEWKPYAKKESIEKLLNDYAKNINIKIEGNIIDSIDIDKLNHRLITDISNNSAELILIIDVFALYNQLNQKFIQEIFGDKHVNIRMLIPLCDRFYRTEYVRDELIKIIKETFKRTYYTFHESYHTLCDSCEFSIPSEQLFFRRLTNILVGKGVLLTLPNFNIDREDVEKLININNPSL